MLAHRREDDIVGWIFSCQECFEVLKGLDMQITATGVKDNQDV